MLLKFQGQGIGTYVIGLVEEMVKTYSDRKDFKSGNDGAVRKETLCGMEFEVRN